MLKKEIKYVDYNEQEQVEDFYFNLTQAELTKMDADYEGGLENYFKVHANKKNVKILKDFICDLISRSVGEKSPDGKRFMKSPEISRSFEENPAYNELFIELLSDDGTNFQNFVKGIVPKEKKNPNSIMPS